MIRSVTKVPSEQASYRTPKVRPLDARKPDLKLCGSSYLGRLRPPPDYPCFCSLFRRRKRSVVRELNSILLDHVAVQAIEERDHCMIKLIRNFAIGPVSDILEFMDVSIAQP